MHIATTTFFFFVHTSVDAYNELVDVLVERFLRQPSKVRPYDGQSLLLRACPNPTPQVLDRDKSPCSCAPLLSCGQSIACCRHVFFEDGERTNARSKKNDELPLVKKKRAVSQLPAPS